MNARTKNLLYVWIGLTGGLGLLFGPIGAVIGIVASLIITIIS